MYFFFNVDRPGSTLMSVNILRYYSTDNLFVKISFLFCIKFLFYFVEDFVFFIFYLFVCVFC